LDSLDGDGRKGCEKEECSRRVEWEGNCKTGVGGRAREGEEEG
jgi:hypothetical protein